MAEQEKRPLDTKLRRRGFTSYCGLEFTELQEDRVVISCPLRPELLNPMGIAHGGIIATATDVAAGCMALMADGNTRGVVTQSCSIHYLRPGTGKELRAVAHVLHKGGRSCVVQVDCLTDDDVTAATAIYEIAYINKH